jgi:hypothetical protein
MPASVDPMRRALLLAGVLACTPPADTVGGWTSATGSSSTGTASIDATTSGTSSSSSSSEAATGSSTAPSSGVDGDQSSSTTAAAAPPPWVVTVAPGAPPRLLAIDLEQGAAVEVCALAGIEAPDALVFLPDDRLVGSLAASATLWIADPCDCTVHVIPAIEPPLSLHALAETAELDPASVVGADGTRAGLFDVRVDLPEVTALGELASAGTITALAAAADSAVLHALAVSDGVQLLRIDPSDGAITSQLAVAIPAGATGLTLAPDGATLLACDDDGALWKIDPSTAAVESLGVLLAAPCRTLAGPHGTVACIDALLE